jgi:hypothetical protein
VAVKFDDVRRSKIDYRTDNVEILMLLIGSSQHQVATGRLCPENGHCLRDEIADHAQ